MKVKASSMLQVPAGSSALFFHEAHAHSRALDILNKTYQSWAYVPVHAPLLDYSSPYQHLMSESDQNKVYHLVGRDGAILMLRWDLTLFLVKQVHSLIGDAKLPLRLCYADSILRHQEAEDISRNEYFQTGVELIGSQGPDGDLEVLLLMATALQELKLKAAIHIGSRSLFEAFFPELEPDDLDLVARAISLRDYAGLDTILADSGLSGKTALAQELFSTICPVQDARSRLEGRLGQFSVAVQSELQKLLVLADSLAELMAGSSFRLDFSELGSQRYHSGIVFQAYLSNIDASIATGGRYDRLLANMGCPQAAVGFSIMLSKVLPHLALNTEEAPALVLDQGSFADRYRQAVQLRNAGKKVQL